MAIHLVNLDALIPREDFEVIADAPPAPAQLATGLKVSELESNSFTYLALRKPDFQRETASWDPEKVVDLIKSFLDGDLIPAVILWRSPTSGNLFVIDGAHRLSVLIAWIQDEYGASKRSLEFFDNLISPEQRIAAAKCRELVLEQVGSYEELRKAVQKPENSKPDRVKRGRNMAAFQIQLQWVGGDAKNAESSFFKINQKATAINPTELLMLESRKKPNAIAARAMIRAGVGHKYWSDFSEEKQKEVQRIARNIYDLLFIPVLETPIKTLDLPVAGRGYSADSVKLVFDLVNFASGINMRVKAQVEAVQPDKVGDETINFLNRVRKIAQRISGDHASSLGLHPAVYFYSSSGRYQPSAFLAVANLIQELEKQNRFDEFTRVREKFENFLVNYRYMINQIVSAYGSGTKSMYAILDMYRLILTAKENDVPDAMIFEKFKLNPTTVNITLLTDEARQKKRNFSTDTKSAAFLKSAIDGAPICQICGARVHRKAMSIDHIERKADGGDNSLSNAQIAHPYCNTGYKEKQVSIAASAAKKA